MVGGEGRGQSRIRPVGLQILNSFYEKTRRARKEEWPRGCNDLRRGLDWLMADNPKEIRCAEV